ncbi:MAG TPA: carbohydrate ABC transporter permease [Anaerolineales bacterium]|nr:carbohydrate ABC transporter permease [Anaerolineales bacterium]
MKKSKNASASQTAPLTFRLWKFTGTALLILFIWIILLVFLSPLSYMVVTSLKSKAELSDRTAPLYPADRLTYDYQGQTYQLYQVPTSDGVIHEWALVQPSRLSSQFVDPAHPEAGLITWQGSWRNLSGVFRFQIYWKNYTDIWKLLDYPRYLRNTFIIIVIGEIGILLSSVAVAYGFSRFRIPGGRILFFLLIATIILPDSITLLPSYYVYVRILPWNGTFYPLIVPAFFGSAIYIFLLRQNFRSIPRDLDEAAMLDGAGPARILISIMIPQAIPAIVTVALLHFFNTWNEMRMSSLYLAIRHDLQPIAFTTQAATMMGNTYESIQASALILMVIPVLILLVSQRFFMQDLVITGMEKRS